MLRSFTLALAAFVGTLSFAQQFALDWATPLMPANNRVKVASTGGAFALGTDDDSAVLQRISEAGTVQWTKTLSAPGLRAVDMDVDAEDNCYIYITFETGQLDLDPGPNSTLVDPGKVYAKYNSTGQFQWGFSIENLTDASEDYGGVSCDDAGNLYICGDLGLGTYDFDFGAGVNELTVGDFSTGSFVARYRPDGSLAWANIETYYGGFCNSRDISAMRDGTSFFIVRELDNGGPLSSTIDIDYGPGEYNVFTETQHILRYDSALQFMAEGNANYGDIRLCADAAGSAYMMAQAQAGAGFWAVKYSQSGTDLEQIYSTPLQVSGNLRLGDIAPDEQGGCLGMYSNNGPGGVIRFYKMNVSGLVDFSLFITCGNDYTYPSGKGFDVDGSAFYAGTFNQNYPVDFDPGPGTVSLPSVNSDDGVVARYEWCQGAPYDPFEISTPGALCTGQPATFTVSAFGDASGYEWTVPSWWTITEGQGTASITVLTGLATTGTVSVSAVNDCGTSAPIALDFTFVAPPLANLGMDIYACEGDQVFLIAQPPDANYLWQDGSTAYLFETYVAGTFSVEVTVDGCTDSDTANVVFAPVPAVDLGPDQVICPGNSIVLNAGVPGASYVWIPNNGEFTQSITVSPATTTTYAVTVTVNGCSGTDEVTIMVDPCLGVHDPAPSALTLSPVPAARGGVLRVEGLPLDRTCMIIAADGKSSARSVRAEGDQRFVDLAGLASGVYTLRSLDGRAVPFVIAE